MSAPRAGTQASAVLAHIEANGSITSMEAFECYGVTRLSSIIHSLRRRHGLRITTVDRLVKNRYGRSVVVAEYRMGEQE